MLLAPSDIKRTESRPVPKTNGHRPVSSFGAIKPGTAIADALPEIKDGHTYHLACFVNWSLHDVLERLLHLTGPAHVCLTSWAISEGPARKISRLLQEGQVLSMHCLFDHRTLRYCPAAMQLVEGRFGRVKLTGIHAKILVVENDSWGISVTSTANATNKRRIEKYVIACDRTVARFERDWIMEEIEK